MNIQLRLKGLTQIVGSSDIGLLVLTDVDEKRELTIVCDEMMQRQIELRLTQHSVVNTMLPEVLSRVLTTKYNADFEIIINHIEDGVYRAVLIDKNDGTPVSLRAADAVLLHLCSKIPLYATEQLMIRQSVPYNADFRGVAMPYNSLSTEMLRTALQNAIDCEKYEVASQLRDELKRRGE